MSLTPQNKNKLIFFCKVFLSDLQNQFSMMALRPKYLPDEEAYFLGDFDFLILREEFEAIFKQIYETCKNEGINFKLIQKFPNKKKFHFFIKDAFREAITVELWTSVEFTKNRKLYTFQAKSIFKTIRTNRLSKAETLFLIYLTHLHHKRKNIFSEENKYRFKFFLEAIEKQGTSQFQQEIIRTIQDVSDEKISLRRAKYRANRWLNASGVKSRAQVFSTFKHYRKAAFKKIFYLHRTVPVVGPDGAGKGIVSENALQTLPQWADFRFKDLYRMRVFYKHLVLRFFNPKNLRKNELDEKLGYYIFVLSSLSIYILPVYLRGKKVLLDRYFLDYYATPIRYLSEHQKPKKLKCFNLLLYLTPIPDRMIFMGCQTQSLMERKNELSETAINYLQNLYIEFILRKKIPEILFISTENEVEISVKAMRDFVE